jgi:hypothetical protein
MIVYVLFVHKKSVSKRKVCIIFIKKKNLKNPKKTKKPILMGFFRWVFLGGFFIANPDLSTSISLLSHPFLYLATYLPTVLTTPISLLSHPYLYLATHLST